VTDAAGGRIHDITVLQRPWEIAANFRDAVLQRLADVVPLAAWQLDDGRAPRPDPDAGVGQRSGGAPALARNVVFHSPLFTKTVCGQENVEALLESVDAIQGPRRYVARLRSTGRLVEYWDCSIDGHLQQGVDVFKLNDGGMVTDLTVWLRPWPVVTLLRDRVIAAKLPFLTPDYLLLSPPAEASPM
jgi:hypothetical protein